MYIAVQKSDCQNVRDQLQALNLFDKNRKLEVIDGIFNLPVISLSEDQMAVIQQTFTDNCKYKIVQHCDPLKIEKKQVTCPATLIKHQILNILKKHRLDATLLEEEIPKSWQIHGDLILLGSSALRSKEWSPILEEALDCICSVLRVNRVARKNPVVDDDFRSACTELMRGSSSWVSHKDNSITYSWDLTRCMFSIGNISEKLRVAKFDCDGEVVLDMFAGIGYFTLPYLVHAKAKHVFACEWNPSSVEALRYNLEQAGVEDRCTVLEGDNRIKAPEAKADRINLGLIPSSSLSWAAACRGLKPGGGMMHVHANVETRQGREKRESWREWVEETRETFRSLFRDIYSEDWSVEEVHLECVKSYAPRIHHIVLDIKCKPFI